MPVRKTIKESRANPSQYNELLEAKGKKGKGRARIEKAGPLTISVLWRAFHFGFVNCKIRKTKNEKTKANNERQKGKKEKKRNILSANQTLSAECDV